MTVRSATSASADAVGRIERTIDEIHSISSSIAAAVEEQGAATAEIARNVAETAAAANAMTDRTAEFSAQAEATGRQASDLREHTASLNGAIEELRHTVVRVVRTSTTEVDRRRSPRHRVDLSCRLQISGREPAGSGYRYFRWRRVAGASACHGCRCQRVVAIDRVGFPLPFTVRSGDGSTLHIAFRLDAATAERFRPLVSRLASGNDRSRLAA